MPDYLRSHSEPTIGRSFRKNSFQNLAFEVFEIGVTKSVSSISTMFAEPEPFEDLERNACPIHYPRENLDEYAGA